MSLEDEFRREMQESGGRGSLGQAENRWVTWQIVMSVVGLIVFALFVLFFFAPLWFSFPRP